MKRLKSWGFLLFHISWKCIDFISPSENIFLTSALKVCCMTFILIYSIRILFKFSTQHQHLVNWNINSTLFFENQNWSQTAFPHSSGHHFFHQNSQSTHRLLLCITITVSFIFILFSGKTLPPKINYVNLKNGVYVLLPLYPSQPPTQGWAQNRN